MGSGHAHITFRPLSDVAIQTHSGDVAAGRKIHRVAIGNEIGKGEVARVGVIHQLAEAHRERSDVSRHENIGAAGCFRAAFECAIMHRPHLVGVITEIGGTPRVIERELSADEQTTLVMAGSEWTAERRARFTIAHVGIGKENAR